MTSYHWYIHIDKYLYVYIGLKRWSLRAIFAYGHDFWDRKW